MPSSGTIIGTIDSNTKEAKLHFGLLNAKELNWKPDPKTWSIAQNMHHLIVINKTYFNVIESIRNKSYSLPFVSKIGFMVNFFGNFILKSVSPDRKQKIKTFPIWEPSTSELPADIIIQFEKHQQELRELISGSADLIEKRTIISSPANRNIVYTLEMAFTIIATHEKRHIEQAKELLDMMKTSN